jgi:hypothetical protein
MDRQATAVRVSVPFPADLVRLKRLPSNLHRSTEVPFWVSGTGAECNVSMEPNGGIRVRLIPSDSAERRAVWGVLVRRVLRNRTYRPPRAPGARRPERLSLRYDDRSPTTSVRTISGGLPTLGRDR